MNPLCDDCIIGLNILNTYVVKKYSGRFRFPATLNEIKSDARGGRGATLREIENAAEMWIGLKHFRLKPRYTQNQDSDGRI